MHLLTTLLLYVLAIVPLTWLLPERLRLLPIAISMMVFLGVHSPVSLMLLATTTLTSWLLLHRSKCQRVVVLIVILQAVAMFVFFKLEYGLGYRLTVDRMIPIGLSYFSFRQIHYAIEAYKQNLPAHTFEDYFNYLFFLPTLLVGPIHRFQDYRRDSIRRRWDAALFSMGLERILYGYAKIVIVGNYLITAKLQKTIENLYETSPWFAAYLNVFAYASNAYMQFSGFSDVAIGLSLLLGFRVVENFNYPFLATSIGEFWKRWHMSLSLWCRDYVYFPALALTRNVSIAILFSMVILGGWHEISLRYIGWGLLHACVLNFMHVWKKTAIADLLHSRLPGYKLFAWLLTIHFVVFSFVLVSEDNIADSMKLYRILFWIS